MKNILLLGTALLLTACSSTPEPVSKEVTLYQESKSLAWNVMNQAGAARLLRDVSSESDNINGGPSTINHLTFAVLSGNFFGGLTTSLLLDDEYPINRENMILSMDLRNSQNPKLDVATFFISQLKKGNANFEVTDLEETDKGYKFIEQSDSCIKMLKIYADMYPDNSLNQKWLARGNCKFKLDIDILGASNDKLFETSKGQNTVRISMRSSRNFNSVIGNFDNAYLYHHAYKYRDSKITSIPFIEKGDTAFLFMKKDADNIDQTIPLINMPNQKYLMLGR